MKKYLLIVALLMLASISSAQEYSTIDTLKTYKAYVGKDTITNAAIIEDTLDAIRLKNGATCWDDLRISGTSVRSGTSAPTFTNGTRTGGVFLVWYSGVQDDDAYTAVQLPHTYKKNSAIYPHVHLYPEAAPNGAQDTIVFGIEYFWLSGADTTLTPNSTDTITKFLVVTTANYRSHIYFALDSIPYNSFSATNKIESSMLMVKIFRPSTTDTRDTYQQNCALLEFDVHFQVEKMGTRNQLP